DLNECTEMDSSSIGLLSNLYKRVKSKNGTLAFINPSKMVMEILENTKIVTIIPNFQSVDEADHFFD
ncbi:MAG: STAS domain-containing protein, partial [Fibrobacteria bacterium]|nr:STAS domain-containing protein [Fibrobacteria bacterium]